MESAPPTRPALAPKPIAPPRLKKQAEKQDKKPPPPIAPYSSQLTGTSPRISPRPAPRSNGESDHSVPVAAVEEVPEPTESSKPPPKPARRSRRNLQKGGDTPPSPRSEGRSEEGGDSEGPAGLSTANGESAVATEDPYLEMEIENCPLRHEGSAHSKVDAQMGSPRAPHLSRDSAHSSIASNHSSIDSAHSSTESTLTSNDPTQPPVEKRRRPPPPPPTHQKQVDRIEKNQLNHLQSSPTDPTVDHEGSPQSPLIQPSSPSPAAASKPTPAGHPAHIEGGIDTAIGSPGNTEMGDSEGNPPSATPLTDSEVAEEKPTTLRPRRKAPPPPIKPTSGQTSSPAVSTDPLHRRRLGSASSLTRSKSLPRSRMRSNQSADSKYNTLGGGARSGSLRHGGHLVLPPSEKEKKKAKLALPGWLKKLSGSPSTKRKTQQESNSASGGGSKRESTKRGQFSSSRSCDDTLAEAVDDHYATVDVTQPVTPASPQVDSLSAQANDTPFLDIDAYSTVDYPDNPPAQDTKTPKALPTEEPAQDKPLPAVEPVYAAVNKVLKKNKVSMEEPSTPLGTSSGAYEVVAAPQERRVGSKVVRQSSKLRLSRALSAESFNLEDFDEEEAIQMWGGRPTTPVHEAGRQVVSPVREAEDVELNSDYATISSICGGDMSVVQNRTDSPKQSEGVSLQQDEGVSHLQDEGPSLPQNEGVSPKPIDPASPKPGKRAPPPVPLPYAMYKQQLASQMKAAEGAGVLSPSPSHTPPGSRSAPGTLRPSPPSPQNGWSSGSGGGPVPGQLYLPGTMIDLNPEDEEDDTDWEGDSDEDDDEDSSAERPKTYQIAKEILKTERTFVQRLTLLDQEFRGKIESYNRSHDRPVVSDETMRYILSNVGSLRLLNTDFLWKLEERFKNWDACPRIGDIMSGFAPYLKMYSDYISKFDRSLRVLDETMKKNPAFYELVKEFEAQPMCANLSVANYMLETVQRIPRYKLLLQDYIKHLPEDSDDTEESKKALDVIARVAQDVNESMRQMDNFRKLVEIEKKLVGDVGGSLITPTRKLLKEGEVTKFSRKERTPRMFFLFSDILLYATTAQPPSFTSYRVIRRMPLLGLRIEDLDDPDVKHGFLIISTSKSFRLEASSDEDKKQWLKITRQAIQELEETESSRRQRRRTYSMCIDGSLNADAPLGLYAPPWLPDSCVSMCMSCTITFTMTRRRHHCRACGNIFCHHCTCFEGALRYKDNKMERVCQTCYETLKHQGVNVKMAKQSKLTFSNTLSSSVLQEVKARDQNSERSGYLLIKGKRGWKRRWFVLSSLALYSFAKHEDRAAKKSIIVPSHQLVYPFEEDPLQFCLTHTGTGTISFKGEDVEDVERWVEVLRLASKGESSI